LILKQYYKNYYACKYIKHTKDNQQGYKYSCVEITHKHKNSKTLKPVLKLGLGWMSVDLEVFMCSFREYSNFCTKAFVTKIASKETFYW